jgi:hypothetical protein
MTSAEHDDGGRLSLTEQPVQVAVGGDDEEGCLIFADDRLVAVLVRLSRLHEGLAGRWYLEAGFGRLEGPSKPTFRDLGTAKKWITQHLTSTADRAE